MSQNQIVVRGAREHNLKNIDVDDPPRQAGRHHRAERQRQEFAGLRYDLRRRPAPLCRVAVRLRPPVPRPDGQARRRPDRRAVARRSRLTRRASATTRARRSAPSPRFTTTCVCSMPASASRTARSAGNASRRSRRSRSSRRSNSWPTARAFRSSPRSSRIARDATKRSLKTSARPGLCACASTARCATWTKTSNSNATRCTPLRSW